MFVVAIGDAFDGLTLHGPFQYSEDAEDWAGVHAGGGGWCVVVLESVTDDEGQPLGVTCYCPECGPDGECACPVCDEPVAITGGSPLPVGGA